MSDRDLPSASSRRALWDQRHAAGDPIESPDPDPTLVDEIASLPPGRALDLGAGDGRNATWLAGRGWKVTAVDFSGVAIARGKTRAEASGVSVDWQLADLLEWSPEARAYDLVTLFFIHLPGAERRAVYARAAAAVAPGGTLLIVAHDRANLASGAGGPQDPDVLVSPDEVAADLNGFRVERADTVGAGPRTATARSTRSCARCGSEADGRAHRGQGHEQARTPRHVRSDRAGPAASTEAEAPGERPCQERHGERPDDRLERREDRDRSTGPEEDQRNLVADRASDGEERAQAGHRSQRRRPATVSVAAPLRRKGQRLAGKRQRLADGHCRRRWRGVGRAEEAHQRRRDEPDGDREGLGRDLPTEDRVRDDGHSEPERDQRGDGQHDGPGDEAPIKPERGQAGGHPRLSWTSDRPLAVQAFIPPSRLSMFV